MSGLPQFFVRKPENFCKCEKRARCGQFSEKLNSTCVNRNFQKFSDLVHKNQICWINHYNGHDTASFLSDYNESAFLSNNVFISGFYSVLHEVKLHSK